MNLVEALSAPDDLMKQARETYDWGRYHEVIDTLTRLIDQDPTCWNAYAVRGKAHLKLGETEQAIRDFTVVIDRSDKPSSEVFWWRARAHLALKRYALAEADLNAGLARCADDWRLWAWRGYVRYSVGSFSRALNDYMESIYRQGDASRQPDSGAAYLGRAFVYTKMHAQSSARVDFSKFKLTSKDSWNADEAALEPVLVELFESPLAVA